MTISLQRYWKLKEAHRLAPTARRDEELVWAGGNPDLPSLLQSSYQTEPDLSPPRPESRI